ncbi:MAG: hypothetical protein ACYTBS_24730 [Planctomycetota bacterium]|jgi:hypothetical protein
MDILKCEKCGNADPTRFQHVEDIQATRSVKGVEDGILIVNGYYETETGLGGDEWFECMKCASTEKIPFPEGVEVDYD